MATPWKRLVRFVPSGASDSDPNNVRIGEPVDADIDVGQALFDGKQVLVNLYSGSELVHSPGQPTGETASIGRLLSPISETQVGTIRCIGLNYISHAKEVGLEVPTLPTLFLKPETSLNHPFPSTIQIPRQFVQDDAADYESEVAIVIGRKCKDVDESEAMQYCLGITAANDVSSRKAQFAQSQWCYSKGFDGSCPIGPTVVHRDAIKDWAKVEIQGKHNDEVVQKSDLNDLIFSIPRIISFLSKGTTLNPGTIILTGTPAGIGWTANPKRTLQHGDTFTFTVSVSNGVGSLINKVEFEK